MKHLVEKAGDTYDVECECGWTSTRWLTKKAATARAEQHQAEHDSGEPMPELADFQEG